MKKLIAFFVCFILAFASGAFVAEGEHYIPKPREEEPELPRIMAIGVEPLATWANVCIAFDSETGVMYLISRAGGICPMIDAEGRPLIYEVGEKE